MPLLTVRHPSAAPTDDADALASPSADLATDRPLHRRLRTWHVALITALVGTVVFFLPSLAALPPGNAHWPAFMLTGDQRMVYFPSFVEGYRRFWHGGILGIDFLTEDGASVFAYRPNIMPFYPPYILAYLLVNCADLQKGMLAYFGITVLHQFLGLYFTVVFVRRYLGLPAGAAILAATLFTLNWYTGAYSGEATFYFQMMLVPVLACGLAWLMRTPSRLAPVWMAPLFSCYALSNYGPMMLGAMGFAILAALLSGMVLPAKPGQTWGRMLVNPSASLALAALSTAAYFGAQLYYKSVMAPTADDINSVAHTLALSAYDLMNGVSQFLDIRRTHYEALLVWGAIPTFLALFGLHVVVVRKAEIRPRYLWVSGVAGLVYVLMLLPMFGNSLLPAADFFYYAMPVVGKMHIFQRFIIFSQFFFAIAIAALTTIIVVNASPRMKIIGMYGGIAIWLAVTITCLVWPPTGPTDTNSLMLEAFLLAVAAVTVAVAPPRAALLIVSVLVGVVGATTFYTLPPALNRPAQWATEPDPLGAETKAMVDFIKANSEGRALSKLVIASAGIEPYFNRNLPWQLGNQVKMMNFQGYPPHLSILADYSAQWATYGQFDIPWLKAAGLDFVFWSDATAGPLASLQSAGFTLGPTLTLPGGHHLARLVAPPDSYAATKWSFDNGILQVSGPANGVKAFKTDYTQRIRLTLDAAEASTVTYLLWPNPYMVPYLDGRRVAWANPGSGPLKLEVGPGHHVVEVKFVSRAGTAFLISQLVLGLLAAAALVVELNRLPAFGRARQRWKTIPWRRPRRIAGSI